jgi:site-specific DNA recombinase
MTKSRFSDAGDAALRRLVGATHSRSKARWRGLSNWVSAGEIETTVIAQLRAPEIVVRTWQAARQSGGEISEAEVRESLERLDPLWGELFPAEQARIVQLLVARVDVQLDRLDVCLRTAGLTKLVDELRERPDPVNARRVA